MGENIMWNTFQVRWVWQIFAQWVTYLFNYLNPTVTVKFFWTVAVEFKLTWHMQIRCFLSFQLTLNSMERIGQKIITIRIWFADLLRILSNSHNTVYVYFKGQFYNLPPYLLIVWTVVCIIETTMLSMQRKGTDRFDCSVIPTRWVCHSLHKGAMANSRTVLWNTGFFQ